MDLISICRFLKGVRMYLISPQECRKIYGKKKRKFRKFPFEKHHQLCAVGLYRNESDCIGDSGGPYVCNGFTIAVVSYGYECGTSTPSVYASISHFLVWFREEFGSPKSRRSSGAGRFHFAAYWLLIFYAGCSY